MQQLKEAAEVQSSRTDMASTQEHCDKLVSASL